MRKLPFTIASCMGLATAAHAADISIPMSAPEPPPLVIEGPTFSFTAYFWAPSISGRTSTLPPLPAVDIDESFTDVIKDFDGGIMGSAELRLGRWGVLTDLMWSQVSPGGTLPGGASVGLRSRSLTVQANLLLPRLSGRYGAVRHWSRLALLEPRKQA